MRLVGVNHGVIPYLPNELDLDPVEYEESELRERCLLHVAATRARETLTVTGWGKLSPLLHRRG